MLRAFLKKKFRKNEIVFRVDAWIALVDERHFVHKAFKLCATFTRMRNWFSVRWHKLPWAFKRYLPIAEFFFFDMALVKMTGNIANMIRIEQII